MHSALHWNQQCCIISPTKISHSALPVPGVTDNIGRQHIDFHTQHISNSLHGYVVTPGSLSQTPQVFTPPELSLQLRVSYTVNVLIFSSRLLCLHYSYHQRTQVGIGNHNTRPHLLSATCTFCLNSLLSTLHTPVVCS